MQTLLKLLAAATLLSGIIGHAAAVEEQGAPTRAQVAKKQAEPNGPYKVDCSISPDQCMTEPAARGCGEGRHWSSSGSGLAHCVEDDRDCANGKAGKRDEYDNLVCADEREAAEKAVEKENVERATRALSQEEEGWTK